ncbi:uncharacterized protein TA08280 [Theileria annulata]|uniref:Uncharacterized protein n=1 Tax=Theileria annulata TaxID=5874 RepID=Q4UAJ6_THEAN|nr:uncharacterized protein TA08280 [Theileria annulata]CAI76155.1 hypothetical protein TA08280 [Theileria annulata]|eukprot:XP_952781.1 hypothetical protein TA08280 [Theileria annulata]
MNFSRKLFKNIPIPKFTQNRLNRRNNMAEQDRAIFYYTNLISIIITTLPIAYLFKKNYWSSEDQMKLDHVLSTLGAARIVLEFSSVTELATIVPVVPLGVILVVLSLLVLITVVLKYSLSS